jgi:hypothetical protein
MDMRPWYDHARSDPGEIAHLYIVSRSNPQLYEFLAQEFAGARGIKVVLDRRERGQPDVRADEERRRQPVDADLHAWELALTSAFPGPSGASAARGETDSESPAFQGSAEKRNPATRTGS